VLTALAITALALTTWDSYGTARSRGKRRRAMIIGGLGACVMLLQCVQTLRSEKQSRERTIEALGAELVANASRTEELLEPDKQQRLQRQLPELQSAAIKGALANASFAGVKDGKILTSLTLLNEQIEDFNGRMRITRQNMLSATAEGQLMWRRKVRDSPALTQIRGTMRDLMQLLVKDYGMDPNRVFFEAGTTALTASPTRQNDFFK
jgi:hypothetical protein